MDDIAKIEGKYQALSSRRAEATLRVWAATQARSLGRGGVSTVARAIGMSRTTIYAGLAELKVAAQLSDSRGEGGQRVRAAVVGRKTLTARTPTCKSTYRLTEELKWQGHQISQRAICVIGPD